MNRDEVVTTLRDVFRSVFDDDSIEITDATTAKDIEGWDSLAHVNLVVAVERRFGTSFTVKEINALSNVGDFIQLIERKKR